MSVDPVHAASRFGFGPGVLAGDPAPGADPRSWLRAQLGGPDRAAFPDTLPTSADALVLLREQRRLKLPPEESLVRPLFRADARAQLAELLRGNASFRERLNWFWSNHFTVSAKRGEVRPLAGCF
ncbi:MAG: DUF1800 family protein, partial [Gluconacetobacter diazotrophicus]|nr:DUF1800 family protein [Gluconacetobacter diazotrophicus]